MEFELVTVRADESAKRNTKRADRVEDADAFDPEMIPIVNVLGQFVPRAGETIVRRNAIVVPRNALVFLGASVGAKQASRGYVSDQRPRGVGTAGESKNEYFVVWLIVK